MSILMTDALVEHSRQCRLWVDLGVTLPAQANRAASYDVMRDVSNDLVDAGRVSTWFFLHKPPGFRWRLQAESEDDVAQISSLATGALLDRAATVATPALYEPQFALFGGPETMAWVHEGWAVDSELWSRWHATADPKPSRIATSLDALADLFSRSGVEGWQDREVWRLVTTCTGRRVAPGSWERPEVARAAREIRLLWDRAWYDRPPHAPASTLGPPSRTGPHPAARTDAGLTPRALLAHWVVFHWNRAGFAPGYQALIAEALMQRTPDDTTA